jgi:hypothetical protein
VKYSTPARNPLVHFATIDGPLIKQVIPSVWLKIFLDLQRDYKTNPENVDIQVIDIKMLDDLANMSPKQISMISGVGPKALSGLNAILEAHRVRQVFLLE